MSSRGPLILAPKISNRLTMNTFRIQSLRICRHNVSPLSKGSSFCNPPTAGRLPATVLGTSQQLLMADGGCSSGRRNSSFSTKICNKFYHTPTLYHQLNNKNRHTYNIYITTTIISSKLDHFQTIYVHMMIMS